jgi:hypothetical protein
VQTEFQGVDSGGKRKQTTSLLEGQQL